MTIHYLKTINPYFQEIWKDNKTFEVRYNDRKFNTGDEIYLQEYDHLLKQYLGREIRANITYFLKDFAGIQKGYVVFSFKKTQHIFKPASPPPFERLKFKQD